MKSVIANIKKVTSASLKLDFENLEEIQTFKDILLCADRHIRERSNFSHFTDARNMIIELQNQMVKEGI